MISSHTPPLLDSPEVPVTFAYCDENGRGCEATRVGGGTCRDNNVGDNDEIGYVPGAESILLGIF